MAAEEIEASVGVLKQYEFRSLDRGVVKAIVKRRGEAVHALEPILRLEVDD